MAHNPHHEHLVKELADQFEPLLKKSPQAMFLYLDDEHKICNKKYADMMGYDSAQDWADHALPLDDVYKKDQKETVKSYMAASKDMECPCPELTMVTKKGKKMKAWVTMVPIPYKGETFVLQIFYPE